MWILCIDTVLCINHWVVLQRQNLVFWSCSFINTFMQITFSIQNSAKKNTQTHYPWNIQFCLTITWSKILIIKWPLKSNSHSLILDNHICTNNSYYRKLWKIGMYNYIQYTRCAWHHKHWNGNVGTNEPLVFHLYIKMLGEQMTHTDSPLINKPRSNYLWEKVPYC